MKYEVNYLPIPPLALPAITRNYERTHPKPQIPTYTVQAVGGDLELPHDETTLETDEEKEAFAKYKTAIREWDAELTNRIMSLMFLHGVELTFDDEQKKAWDNRLERMFDLEGLDEDDFKMLYLQTFIFKTEQSIQDVIKRVMSLTGVKEEDREAAEKLF